MTKDSGTPLTDEQKRELEISFLESVRERIGEDVAAAERGDYPRKWEGDEPPTPEETEEIRAFHQRAGEVIEHLRSGGAIDDTAAILWGHTRVVR